MLKEKKIIENKNQFRNKNSTITTFGFSAVRKSLKSAFCTTSILTITDLLNGHFSAIWAPPTLSFTSSIIVKCTPTLRDRSLKIFLKKSLKWFVPVIFNPCTCGQPIYDEWEAKCIIGPKMQKNKSKLTPLKLTIAVKGWVIYVRNKEQNDRIRHLQNNKLKCAATVIVGQRKDIWKKVPFRWTRWMANLLKWMIEAPAAHHATVKHFAWCELGELQTRKMRLTWRKKIQGIETRWTWRTKRGRKWGEPQWWWLMLLSSFLGSPQGAIFFSHTKNSFVEFFPIYIFRTERALVFKAVKQGQSYRCTIRPVCSAFCSEAPVSVLLFGSCYLLLGRVRQPFKDKVQEKYWPNKLTSGASISQEKAN